MATISKGGKNSVMTGTSDNIRLSAVVEYISPKDMEVYRHAIEAGRDDFIDDLFTQKEFDMIGDAIIEYMYKFFDPDYAEVGMYIVIDDGYGEFIEELINPAAGFRDGMAWRINEEVARENHDLEEWVRNLYDLNESYERFIYRDKYTKQAYEDYNRRTVKW